MSNDLTHCAPAISSLRFLADRLRRDGYRLDKAWKSRVFCVRTFAVVVDTLRACLRIAHESYEKHGIHGWKKRFPIEYDALMIVYVGLCAGMCDKLVEAGLVSEWLSRYPFTKENATVAEKQTALEGMRGSDDGIMRVIVARLLVEPAARKEMRKHDMIGSGFTEHEDDEMAHALGLGLVREPLAIRRIGTGSEETENEDDDADADGDVEMEDVFEAEMPAPRDQPDNWQTSQQRRRRRDAMVLAETGEVITAANIFQAPGGEADEVEQQVQIVLGPAPEVEESLFLPQDGPTLPDPSQSWD